MAGNQFGWQQGPAWSETALIGSEDIRITLMPGATEIVMMDSLSTDLSAAAVAIDASGRYLMPGLCVYKSTSGVFAPCGHIYGNSPGISPTPDLGERPWGILMEGVWMIGPDGSTVIDKPAAVSRGGHHIDYAKVHDKYGNTNNMLPYFTNPLSAKYFKGIPFLFSQDWMSAGGATP
jgi:hypothetical protein